MMMNHAAESWDHAEFKIVLLKCANPENLYKVPPSRNPKPEFHPDEYSNTISRRELEPFLQKFG